MKKHMLQMTTLSNILKKGQQFVTSHKRWSIVFVVAMILGGYWLIQTLTGGVETRYVMALVERRNIVSTVGGSGQVSTSDQMTLSAKASGELISLNVKTGQEVKAGATIAQIESGDAYYNLETAQLSYDKLINTNQNSLRDAENAVIDAERSLDDAYINTRISLTVALTDMVNVKEGLGPLFNCNTGYLSGCHASNRSDTEKEYRGKAESSWYDADNLLDELSKKYQTISQTSTKEEIESAVLSARDVAIAVAESAKYTQDAVIYFRDRASNTSDQTEADASYALVTPLVSSSNSVVSSLTTYKNSITTGKQVLEDAKYKLDDIKNGSNPLDIRSSKLSLEQKQKALSDYSVRAPFAGIIASISVKRGDSVNSGTAVAILITKNKIAEISLNEIDVAKVKVGQKATLTFDAVLGLTISGVVTEIDSVGTVSQGVVTYNIKISFDTQDEHVKPAMSVSTSVITDVKQDVLVVPNSAVKSQGGASYVEMFDVPLLPPTDGLIGSVSKTIPNKIPVEVGLSNDSQTEIVSGLKEGDEIIIRTILSKTTTTTATPSLFGSPATGNRGGGGGGLQAR
ncbi:MAG: efflux RND transporter periplasmic adaptor subunit [bacterium]|nr:efflux RND transporter periplasmic adaptor subunit [bacterium]